MPSCTIAERDGQRYAICLPDEHLLSLEQDALELVGVCAEAGVSLLVLDAEALSPDFFELRTGLAGMVLQKFVNYGIRVALVLRDAASHTGRFAELLAESNRGQDFRAFATRDEAERWLTG